jgi:hypothetical protein
VSLKSVNIQTSDNLVCLDVASLFTSIPVDEALQLNSDKLPNDDMLAKRPVLQVSHHGTDGGLSENHKFSGG